MSLQYKEFNSAEFTNRDTEFERVEEFMKERNRGVLIFEGERGGGKTTFLFELYRRLTQQRALRPFLISLSRYSAREFETNKNHWLDSERDFEKEDIPTVLNRMTSYLEIDAIETDDRDFQKDYFARGLAYRSAESTPVLLVDSIYECPDDVRIEFEKYILAPILASERVFVILTGRGKRPIWSRPELRDADIIKIEPLEHNFVIEQLEKLKKRGKSKRDPNEYDEIAELSGGYPLIVRVMAESDKPLLNALDEAIDIIIEDTLPIEKRKDLESIRSGIEKLALVDIPFRIPDIDEYLYRDNPRAETNKLINTLLESHLLRYEGKGYQLNQSVVYPIRKWLNSIEQGTLYMEQLRQTSLKLQEEYPTARAWYQGMLPKHPASYQNDVNTLNIGKAHYA